MKNNNNDNQKMGFLAAELVKPKVITEGDVPYASDEEMVYLLSLPNLVDDYKEHLKADKSTYINFKDMVCNTK